jgi:ankyrin repeat protein
MFFRSARDAGLVSSSQRGTTPLHRACAANELSLIETLIAHGADVNLNTAAQQTCLMLVVEARGREDDLIPTLRALVRHGADVNVVHRIIYMNREHGGTALHMATQKGAKKLMAELVALGADPDIKDEDGLTALDYAESRGWLPYLTTRPPPRQDLAKLLRQLGATVELTAVPNWPGEFPPIGPPRHREAEIWPL